MGTAHPFPHAIPPHIGSSRLVVGWALPTTYLRYHHHIGNPKIGNTHLVPIPCSQMPDYRRAYTPGGAIFLTLVTFDRRPIFAEPDNVNRLRQAVTTVKAEMPFDITAAVVLPDHIHFVWSLPSDDGNYSKRVGRLKVLFTRSLKGSCALPQDVSISRQRQRESDVWQRRFWEHTIRDEADWIGHINYLHYNPVKHGLVECPHQWEFSSFRRFVGEGFYDEDWVCGCKGKETTGEFTGKELVVGE